MFAPAHHSAMKHVIAARREIGIRTIFNLLGPLTNPAAAPNQIIGVFDSDWIPILLEVLRDLGSSHILIVAAEDGLDEISTASSTVLGELCSGEISVKRINPEEFGIERIEDTNIFQVGSPEDSLNLIKQALVYEHQAAGDIVALNAGAAIYVANLADSLIDGVEKAKLIMRSGAALTKLEALVAFTNNLGK